VRLKNVSQFEISENILEMSNTAKITIPRNYALLKDKPILEQFKVGDRVTIESGYDNVFKQEFAGYISRIDSDIPLVIECEDETYPLRQSNFIKSYKDVTLKQVLTDILAGYNIEFECPDVNLGKYQIDNASAYNVLHDLMTGYGMYSRLQNGYMRVGLAFDFGDKSQGHEYVIGKNVKKNELKYKRKEDFKIRFNAIAMNPNGTKTKAVVGIKDRDASERTLHFVGLMTESELSTIATSYLAKVVFDGYTGSITGFGSPRTHAGDALAVIDELEPDRRYRDGKYLIEKVDIAYNESSGFSRQNTLSYKIENTAQNA
jgi:hypothetical protein